MLLFLEEQGRFLGPVVADWSRLLVYLQHNHHQNISKNERKKMSMTFYQRAPVRN